MALTVGGVVLVPVLTFAVQVLLSALALIHDP